MAFWMSEVVTLGGTREMRMKMWPPEGHILQQSSPGPFALCLEDTTNAQQQTIRDSALSLCLMGQ